MLVLAVAYAVIPSILNKSSFDDRLSRTAFWIIFVGILGMTLSFALGGTVQVYVYRVLGIEFFGPVVRPAMQIWKGLLFVFGVVFTVGVIALVYDLLTLGNRHTREIGESGADLHERWWQRPLSAFEMGGWLAALWVIGLMLTGALLVNNLTSVRAGDPTFPYLLAGIGYPALVLVTLLLAIRFLHACNVSYR